MSSQQAIVSFTAPADTGGTPILSYTVTCNPGAFTGTGNTSPITVTGLTNGTEYSITVFATNEVGNGPESTPVLYTPSGLPGAPTNVAAA
jgi:hypothetical protein